MVVRIRVEQELLIWAAARARISETDLAKRFPRFDEWMTGQTEPTLKQLEAFARLVHVPVGALLLAEPPDERLPIPDYRTVRDASIAQPSPDLLESIYLCEQRQEWFRAFAQVTGQPEVQFVGSLDHSISPPVAAARMRAVLRFEAADRGAYPTWTDALRGLVEHAEAAGVLVMLSGVVGSNTHRKLDVDEFRGFALVDRLAPLVFVNGADSKAAQIFTVVHELAHLWLGTPALSSAGLTEATGNEVERWCNEVAAEVLVSLESLRSQLIGEEALDDALARLARLYKVSTLVVLRRLRDAGSLTWEQYRTAFADELARVQALRPGSTGGSFYNTQPVRVSKRFARAVITDTLEGRTLYRDAFGLLGFKKASTFDELSRHLEVT